MNPTRSEWHPRSSKKTAWLHSGLIHSDSRVPACRAAAWLRPCPRIAYLRKLDSKGFKQEGKKTTRAGSLCCLLDHPASFIGIWQKRQSSRNTPIR
jgi:ssDNA-binding Zn-finger/Zn-ribbon topoisomerase 1